MDTPTSAALDEKKLPSEQAVATQPGKEKSNSLRPAREIRRRTIHSSVARLTTNSMDELHKLVSELQKMQEFLKIRARQRAAPNRQRGVRNKYHRRNHRPVEKHGGLTTLPSGTRNVRTAGLAAHIEQRIRG